MTIQPADRAHARSALIAATLASFLTPFLGSSINVALPAIGADLGMTAVQLSWVATAFLLTSAVCLVPFGRAADLFGRKRVFLTGTIVFTLASIACAGARTGLGLLIARGVQGLGSAMIFGTGLAILTSAYPANERGRVLGLNASAVYLGLSIGPFVGGVLTQTFGWPSLFLAPVPVALLAAGVAHFGLRREGGGAPSDHFDWLGVLLYAGAMLAAMSGLSLVPSAQGTALVVGAAVAFFGFIRWERRHAHPLFDLRLFDGNPVFAWSNVAALINYSSTASVAFLVSLYLQYIRGLQPSVAGTVLLTQSVVMTAVSPIAGRLSDWIEPRFVASAGMLLTAIGLGWFCGMDAGTPFAAILANLAIVGFGFGLFSSPNTNAVMSAVPKPQYGVASATLGTMRLLGQMASMGVVAAILAFFVGHTTITPATHPHYLAAMQISFGISAGLCALGSIASLARGNVRRPDRSPT